MSLADEIVNLVFPHRCIVCKAKSKSFLCDECFSKLDINFPRCRFCSRPVASENSICIDCLKGDRQFSKGFVLFNYRDGISNRIVEFAKFYEQPRVFDILFYFSSIIKDLDVFEGVDFIIPVAMHRKDIKARSYNQSVVLAKTISKITDIKVCFDCVEKIRQTKKQVGLSAKERKRNLKGAFRITKELKCKKVIIVDDVFTTGSTINEIASLFKAKGIETNFFTFAATPQS
ncbi:ComF family protein [Hippea alviniae]|uniref:ComF family protein n=1 Tax=Hippea alviniae TaxID=1279027 RepID=UPI0003B343CF|nr:double zinc ribbon domain-containing protein [Hippea alviniae]